MIDAPQPLDISRVPELVAIAEEVQATQIPRLLRRNGEDVAVLVPVSRRAKRRTQRAKREADHEAFLLSAGGWRGLVDADQLLTDISESRRRSSRPPVEL